MRVLRCGRQYKICQSTQLNDSNSPFSALYREPVSVIRADLEVLHSRAVPHCCGQQRHQSCVIGFTAAIVRCSRRRDAEGLADHKASNVSVSIALEDQDFEKSICSSCTRKLDQSEDLQTWRS